MSYQLNRKTTKAHGEDRATDKPLKLEKEQTQQLKRVFDYNQTVGLKRFKSPPVQEEPVYEPIKEEQMKPTTGRWGIRFAQSIFTFILVGLVGISFATGNKIHWLDRNSGISNTDLGHVQTSELKLDDKSAADYLYALGNTLNIMVLGVDEGGYDEGRSDAMILFTLRKDSSDIKMTSFMRDTISYSPKYQTYEKLNHNYAYGGPIETLRAINMNYDLNVGDFVVFDNAALIKLINEIGGVEVEFDQAELDDYNYVAINGWETNAEPIYEPGRHLISGYQAKIYMQIRQTSGGDEARTARQREVLYDIFSKSKNLGKSQLLSLAKTMLPMIRTSYNLAEMTNLIEYYQEIKGVANLVQAVFPFEKSSEMSNEVWYEVPVTVSSNVAMLHKFLYGIDNYQLTDRAQEYADYITNAFYIYPTEQ